MKKIILVAIAMFSFSAYAANYTDLAIEAGVRSQNGDIAGADTDAKIGYQFGVTGAFPIADMLSLRTGFLYSQKNVEVSGIPGAGDYKFTYVEVPATLMFKFTESAGAYAGVALSLNLDDECGAGSCTSTESVVMPILIGAAFKFAPQLGLNLYYETITGKLASGVDDFRAVGANLMITFD